MTDFGIIWYFCIDAWHLSPSPLSTRQDLKMRDGTFDDGTDFAQRGVEIGLGVIELGTGESSERKDLDALNADTRSTWQRSGCSSRDTRPWPSTDRGCASRPSMGRLSRLPARFPFPRARVGGAQTRRAPARSLDAAAPIAGSRWPG